MAVAFIFGRALQSAVALLLPGIVQRPPALQSAAALLLPGIVRKARPRFRAPPRSQSQGIVRTAVRASERRRADVVGIVQNSIARSPRAPRPYFSL